MAALRTACSLGRTVRPLETWWTNTRWALAGGRIRPRRARGEFAGSRVVGRDAELARLFRAVDARAVDAAYDARRGPDPVPVLVGEAGTGKSALLDAVVRHAASRGTRVLRAAGSESESGLAFSALHQLLRSVAAETDALPAGQRAALRDAFGAGRATAAPDLMLVGLAVLTLLSGLGDRGPVLVVLDDGQWCDRASLDALSFAARRLAGEPVTVLVAARAGDPPRVRPPRADAHPRAARPRRRRAAARPPADGAHRPDQGPDPRRGPRQPLALTELARSATAYGHGAEPPPAGPSRSPTTWRDLRRPADRTPSRHHAGPAAPRRHGPGRRRGFGGPADSGASAPSPTQLTRTTWPTLPTSPTPPIPVAWSTRPLPEAPATSPTRMARPTPPTLVAWPTRPPREAPATSPMSPTWLTRRIRGRRRVRQLG
ncbi:AAA family ATPase [Streptomyces sp. M19]